MFNEIVDKYGNFSDALISEIVYRIVNNSRNVEMCINCMNVLNDSEYETIKLTFADVVYFHFHENENESSTFVNSVFLMSTNDIIMFDFFPLIYGRGNLEENKNSDLKVKCRKVYYHKM